MALQILIHETLVSVGDTVAVGQKIREGDKERIQNFTGVLIAIKGNSGEKTFTVRRIAAAGIGVEKVLPVDLPSLVSISVLKRSRVRRSKLYFLRERSGKSALLLPERKTKLKPVKPKKDDKTLLPKKSSGTTRRRGRQKLPRKK